MCGGLISCPVSERCSCSWTRFNTKCGLHLNMHDDLLLALCFFCWHDCIHLSPEEVLFVTKKRNKIPELCNLALAWIQAISWIAAEYLTPLISQQSIPQLLLSPGICWGNKTKRATTLSEELIILKPIDFCDPSKIRILTSLASSSFLYSTYRFFQEKTKIKDLSTKIEILTTNWSLQSLNAATMNWISLLNRSAARHLYEGLWCLLTYL